MFCRHCSDIRLVDLVENCLPALLQECLHAVRLTVVVNGWFDDYAQWTPSWQPLAGSKDLPGADYCDWYDRQVAAQGSGKGSVLESS